MFVYSFWVGLVIDVLVIVGILLKWLDICYDVWDDGKCCYVCLYFWLFSCFCEWR